MEPTTGGTLPAYRRLTIQPSMTPEDLDEELLPGIHNDLTLRVIIPKLSWRKLASLCSISPGWENAVKGGLVHHARVWARCAETLVAISIKIGNCLIKCSLFSMRDKSWYDLPPIPGFQRGMPSSCQFVALDYKIFVLGGWSWRRDRRRGQWLSSNRVYVMDLAAVERQWKKCSSMREPRECFGANVINGKIYVFGGYSHVDVICGAEVYDPVIDAWSRVKPMSSLRFNHGVVTIGEELFVYGGEVVNAEQVWDDDPRSTLAHLEVYHSVKDEWRLIAPVGMFASQVRGFTAQGKFHALTLDGIYVYDIDKLSWTFCKSCPLPASWLVDSFADLSSVLHVDGELFVIVDWYAGEWMQRCILVSTALGHETKQIEWEIVKMESPVSIAEYAGIDSPLGVELANSMCSMKI